MRILCLLFVFFVVWRQPATRNFLTLSVQHTFHPTPAANLQLTDLPQEPNGVPTLWEAAAGYLPEEILARVKLGELAFTIQETTDLPVSEAYINATKQHAEHVKIGADGELEGYVAGLPFPVLDPVGFTGWAESRMDMRHRDFGDVVQVWNTFRLLPESGLPAREIENYYVIAYGMHRPRTDGVNPNRWAEDGILYKEFFHILSPFDLKNSMSLNLRHARDRRNDDNWVYSPASRKIRKMILKMDEGPYDSGFLNEDVFGYGGYLRACQWKLLGERRFLAPVGAKVASTTFGGRGNWYPVDPWELRDMVILECRPTADGHLYGKRVLYIDKQMFVPAYALLYDQEGETPKDPVRVVWQSPVQPRQ